MPKYLVSYHSAVRCAVIVPEGDDPPAGFKEAGWFTLDDPDATGAGGEPVILIRAKKTLRIFGFPDANDWDLIDWEGEPDHELPTIPPGVDNALPTPPATPDQGLPPGTPATPGVPVQGLPGVPDNALPDEQPYPDNSLPSGAPATPDQGLPGKGVNPDLNPNLNPDAGLGGARPDQGLPPGAAPKK